VLPNLGLSVLIFFEEDNTSITVTSARYVEMVNGFLLPELRRRRVNMQKIWFQKDGATAHNSESINAGGSQHVSPTCHLPVSCYPLAASLT
jgi:hypothetical protein